MARVTLTAHDLQVPPPQVSARSRKSQVREWLLVPGVLFLISRALLAVLAEHASSLLRSPRIRGNSSLLPSTDVLNGVGNWTRPWFHFDAGWYIGVVQHGYHWGPPDQASTNFMPLYPAITRLLEPFTLHSAWLSAWLVSNVAFLFALIVLWRWANRMLPCDVAMRSTLLLVAFPFSFFYITPYAESLFLGLAVLAFLLAEEDHWAPAIAVAGLSAVARPVGLAVVLGLVALALSRGDRRHAGLALLSLAPLVAFIAYLTLAFGQPLAFLTAHSAGWVSPHGGLLTTLGAQFHTQFSPFDRVDAFFAVVFLASGVLAWRRLGAAYGVFVLVGVLLPLAHGLVSMERYVIVLFPAFAAWASINHKVFQVSLFAISILCLIFATCMFAVGYTLI